MMSKYFEYLDSNKSLLIILSVGFFLRIIIFFIFKELPLASDAETYHQMSLKLFNGEDFTPFMPPGVPYYLMTVYKTFGISELNARASMLLFYVLSSLIFYIWLKELINKKMANLGVIIFSFFPAYIWHSVEPFTQYMTLALLLAIGFLIHKNVNKINYLKLIIIGLLVSFSILTRSSNILLILIVPLLLYLKTKKIKLVVFVFIVSLLPISLWILKTYNMTNRFIIINEANSINFFYGNNPYTPLYKTWWFGSHSRVDENVPIEYLELQNNILSKPEEDQSRLFKKIAVEHIISRPDLFLLRSFNRIKAFFAFDTSTGASLREMYGLKTLYALLFIALDFLFSSFIFLGAILYFLSCEKIKYCLKQYIIPVVFILIYSFPYWFSFSHPKYHFPILPFITIFTLIFIWKILKHPSEIKNVWLLLKKRKIVGFLSFGIFLFIQIEWAFFNLDRL